MAPAYCQDERISLDFCENDCSPSLTPLAAEGWAFFERRSGLLPLHKCPNFLRPPSGWEVIFIRRGVLEKVMGYSYAKRFVH